MYMIDNRALGSMPEYKINMYTISIYVYTHTHIGARRSRIYRYIIEHREHPYHIHTNTQHIHTEPNLNTSTRIHTQSYVIQHREVGLPYTPKNKNPIQQKRETGLPNMHQTHTHTHTHTHPSR